MSKIKSKVVAETAYKAACKVYGPSTYRKDNTATNYGAEFNVGKWYEGHWCSDCLGFVHIMVNGFTGDKSKLGGGAIMDDFVWASDEARTLNAFCSKRGKFPKTDPKPAMLLQSSGHVGLYIGTDFTSEYNTAECTTAKGGGWVLTWTDLSTGARYSQRTNGYYISSWENWGLFDRVDYEEKKVFPKVPFSVNVLIDDLNIRKLPGTEAKIVGTAPKGHIIVDKVNDDWGHIGKGWIYLGSDTYTKIGEHIEPSPFSDVKIDDPAYPAIKAVYDAGLMKGSNGKFKPKGKVTRKQLAIVLSKILKKIK